MVIEGKSGQKSNKNGSNAKKNAWLGNDLGSIKKSKCRA